MSIEIATKEDILHMKEELLNEIRKIGNTEKNQVENNSWLRSRDIRKMLKISPGSLQNLRESGQLPFSKINGTIFYLIEDVKKLLDEAYNKEPKKE